MPSAAPFDHKRSNKKKLLKKEKCDGPGQAQGSSVTFSSLAVDLFLSAVIKSSWTRLIENAYKARKLEKTHILFVWISGITFVFDHSI